MTCDWLTGQRRATEESHFEDKHRIQAAVRVASNAQRAHSSPAAEGQLAAKEITLHECYKTGLSAYGA